MHSRRINNDPSLLPLGRSGLKRVYRAIAHFLVVSPSAWKEWIETRPVIGSFYALLPSPSAWKEWIETLKWAFKLFQYMSPSAWKEWIETPFNWS